MSYDDRSKGLAELEGESAQLTYKIERLISDICDLCYNGPAIRGDLRVALAKARMVGKAAECASLQRSLDELTQQAGKETP